MDQQTKDRGYYSTFVGLTPIALFFDGLSVLGIIRGSLSVNTLTIGVGGLLLSVFMFRMRPKVAKPQAVRFVLVLLGILVASAAANVLVLLLLRNLTLAGAIYIGGFVLEFIVANRLLRRAGFMPARSTSR